MRRVTVDIDSLVAEGVVDKATAEKIAARSGTSTTLFAIQFFIGVCIAGLAAASALLDPEFRLIPLGAFALFAAGLFATHYAGKEWFVATHTSVIIGTIGLCAWVLKMNPATESFVPIALLLLVAGVMSKNSLLVGLAVVATTPLLNLSGMYHHAMYGLIVQKPLMTIATYTLIGVGAIVLARKLEGAYARMSGFAAGTSFFIVNLGFWVGSLWGDSLGGNRYDSVITPTQFALAWAALSGLLMVAGLFLNKRAAVNLGGVFLSINLFTQWHEWFAREPSALLLGSVIGIAVALLFAYYNMRADKRVVS
ncbi:MAG: hypothetical protein AAB421_00955 [Patescibacteria group bacterium]